MTAEETTTEPLCERTIRACIDALPAAITFGQPEVVTSYRARAITALESLLPPPDPAREERERILGLMRAKRDMALLEAKKSSSLFGSDVLRGKASNIDVLIQSIERLDHHREG